MLRSTIYKFTAACLFLMMVAVGCGDNSTGTEPGEPPEIPEITAAQPDFSYFNDGQASKSKAQNGDAYGSAQSTALGAQIYFSFGQIGTSYFNMAEGEEPDFDDGEWVWSYNMSYEGESMEFKLTADVNENANEVNWAYYITYTGGEEEFIDYKYMEGTTSIDGNSGSWQINEFLDDGSSQPVMVYEWDIDSEDNLTASFSFPGSDSVGTVDYVQDGTAHTLTMEDGSDTLEVYWDTEADHGYWSNGSETLCWSSGKDDVACSDIGF